MCKVVQKKDDRDANTCIVQSAKIAQYFAQYLLLIPLLITDNGNGNM